jgi:hypothetical protein
VIFFIQTTYRQVGTRAAGFDFPEIVFIPGKRVWMQVIHIVFNLMITALKKSINDYWEKSLHNVTKLIFNIKAQNLFYEINFIRGNILRFQIHYRVDEKLYFMSWCIPPDLIPSPKQQFSKSSSTS